MNLMKVVLIDDEILALNYLKNLIDWEQYGFEIAGAYTNPVKALRDVDCLRPDIIFVDIRMPIMNGLEFCKKAVERKIPFRMVILTSYKDFDYAREALSLGVSNYLLKHEINCRNILHELDKLQVEVKEQRKKQRFVNRQILSELLAGRDMTPQDLMPLTESYLHKAGNFIFLLFCMDVAYPVIEGRPAGSAVPEAYDISEKFRNTDESDLDGIDLVDCLLVRPGIWGVLAGVDMKESQRRIWEKIHMVCYSIQKEYRERTQQTLSVVISTAFKEIAQLNEAYREIEEARPYLYLSGKEKILKAQEINHNKSLTKQQIKEHLLLIENKLGSQDIEGTAVATDSLFLYALNQYFSPHNLKFVCNELIDILNRYRGRNSLPSMPELLQEGKIDTELWYRVADIHKWFIEEFRKAIYESRNAEYGCYSRKVQQIITMIKEHYAEDITISQLGEMAGMNCDYLRHVFKDETGKTILDYISHVRLEKAKKLLEKGEKKIYEIAEMVGYGSSQYFSQVFKKATGINPVEYSVRKNSHV